MSEPYIGQIMIFAGNFAPRNWAFCNGQTLNISQNAALFSIIGMTYGGNGSSTFALPDLRGRVPVHYGTGLGLSSIVLGQTGGVEQVTLNSNQMPQHFHNITPPVSSAAGNATSPVGGYPAQVTTIPVGRGGVATAENGYSNTYSGSGAAYTTTIAGGSQPFGTRNPFLALNFCIALTGIFPSRN